MLNSKQRSNLRSQASKIEVIAQVGKLGINDNQIKSLSDALEARELIKIRVLLNNDDDVTEIGIELSQKLKAEFVAATGRTIVLYRKSSRKDFPHLTY